MRVVLAKFDIRAEERVNKHFTVAETGILLTAYLKKE